MKYFIIFSFCLIACQTPEKNLLDSPITAAEEKIAQELIQGSFDDLWAGFDSTKILNYHTDDFIILENGHIWDNDRIKKFMRDQIAKNEEITRTNRMEYISIDKYGESMQIAYHNFAEFTRADTLVYTGRWLESALAIKTDAKWKLKMMHSTWVGNK